ncbi:MAG TPA: SAM-dependent methyltransferase [Candidatus Limnocylindrales bacterium]
MDIRPELRRAPPDTRPLPPSDPVLVEHIRAEIETTGPLTFARFMELALADPEHGYYATSEDRPTRAGDFLTAPELHPIFGAVVARSLDEQWRALDRPARFLVREYGAGTGALAESILRGLADDRRELVDAIAYEPVEITAVRLDRIRERLAGAGFAATLAAAEASEPPLDGAILANEFLDALPVHRVVQRDGRLVERHVGWSAEQSRFEDVDAAPSSPAVAGRLSAEGIELAEGQAAEVRLATDDWVAAMSGRIGRGFVTIVDYGAPATDLYGPTRHDGTLRAYTGQRAHADPYVAIGRQDLTAHVDFTALERAAAAQGWRSLGLTTQAEFLMGSGFGALFAARQSAPDVEPEAYLALRASAARLLDPRALGGFRVLVLGRGVPDDTALGGLGYRLQGQE